MSKQHTNVTGTVKNFFEDKGFGFIATKEIGDVFFHANGCDRSYEIIRIGDVVSFDAIPSQRKPGSYEAQRVALAS